MMRSFADMLPANGQLPTTSACDPWHCFTNRDAVSHIYFTSGSTGHPKGCVISQQALLSYCSSKVRHLAVLPTSSVLQASAISFDPSLTDIISTFLAGACLVTSTRPRLLASLAATIQTYSVSHVLSTPALLETLSTDELDWVESSQLQVIALGGEACSKRLVRAWASRVRLVNVYGVTECCGYQSYCDLTPTAGNRNLGQPFDTVSWFTLPLDDDSKGARHELCLAGPQVGLGYLNQRKLSLQHFSADTTHGRFYRTGDIVTTTADGIKLLGRLDYQVKIRGNRLQLDEVEDTIATHLGSIVRKCVVVVAEGKLVAWLQSTDRTSDRERSLLQDLVQFTCQQLLPGFMCPHYVFDRTDWPLSASGKISRKVLTAKAGERLHQQHWLKTSTVSDQSNSLTDCCVLRTCQSVLGLSSRPSLQLSLTQLGGDSLAALHITRKLRAELIEATSSSSLFGEEFEAAFLPLRLLQAASLKEYGHALNAMLDEPVTATVEDTSSALPQPNDRAVDLSDHRLLHQIVQVDAGALLQAALPVVDLPSSAAESLLADSLVQGAVVCTAHLWQSFPNVHNSLSINGSTWLQRAIQGGKPETVKLMLDYQLAWCQRSDDNEQTVWHWAARYGAGTRILDLLWEHASKSISKVDVWQRNPLHWAVQNGHLTTATFLHKNGCSSTLLDEQGESALAIAERRAQCRAQDRPEGLRPSTFGSIAKMLGGTAKTKALKYA
eukprot:m.169116 g.169116  ORF g.169116 m.169116 type:complete len:724 (+) comp16665_c0_seq1:459-2630(+)